MYGAPLPTNACSKVQCLRAIKLGITWGMCAYCTQIASLPLTCVGGLPPLAAAVTLRYS